MTTGSVLALVPAYNPDPEQLARTLESLVTQTVPVDICVINDGSDQPLEGLLQNYPRVTLINRAANGGITAALRDGVEYGLAHYEYFCRLDVGDIAYPARVELQRTYMEHNPDVFIVGSRARVIDERGNMLHIHGVPGRDEPRNYAMSNASFKHSSFLIRKAWVKDVGSYDLRFNGAEDYELLLRAAQSNGIACLEEVLIDYVDSPNGISSQKRRLQLRMRLRAQLAHRSPHRVIWYIGVGRTLATLAVPAAIAKFLSNLHWRSISSVRL